jgi:hypothetical protein
VSTRVYVPTTAAGLAAYVAAGALPAGAGRFVPEGTDEEEEYAALMEAADASAGMPDGGGRRVVVVAEVADPDGEIPWRRVVSVHVDTEAGAHAADPDAELAWFATQEVPDLLAGWGTPFEPGADL